MGHDAWSISPALQACNMLNPRLVTGPRDLDARGTSWKSLTSVEEQMSDLVVSEVTKVLGDECRGLNSSRIRDSAQQFVASLVASNFQTTLKASNSGRHRRLIKQQRQSLNRPHNPKVGGSNPSP